MHLAIWGSKTGTPPHTDRNTRHKTDKDCKTQTRRHSDKTTNKHKTNNNKTDQHKTEADTYKTETSMSQTKQRERDPTSGQPTDSAENPEKQRKRNNSKTQGKRKSKSKAKNKGDRDRALDREEMDWTGLDWEDGDGNVLRETQRTSRPSQAHGSLHSTCLCGPK